MVEHLPLRELAIRLERSGHRLESAPGLPSKGVRVLHQAEDYITVGLELDPVLKEPYRQRFFLCIPEAEVILAPNDFSLPNG